MRLLWETVRRLAWPEQRVTGGPSQEIRVRGEEQLHRLTGKFGFQEARNGDSESLCHDAKDQEWRRSAGWLSRSLME